MPEIEVVVGEDKPLKLHVDAIINLHDIVGQLNEDELFDLIVGLDRQCADWSLTNRLWEHFKNERKEFLKEFPGIDDTEDCG
jgi:hypothetical protein